MANLNENYNNNTNQTVNMTEVKNKKKCFESPPDHGFSWIILLAGFICVAITTPNGAMFGIIFSHKIKSLEMSSLDTAFAFNWQASLLNVGFLICGPLCAQWGWRKIAMSGVFLCSLSIFATTYVKSKMTIYFSFSLLTGLGTGLIFSTSLFIVSHYFHRRRGMAIAIVGSGLSAGQFTLPLLIRFMQDNYGFHGSAIIYSAFLLHGCIAVMFFHPLQWHTEKQSQSTLAENRDHKIKPDNDISKTGVFNITLQLLKRTSQSFFKILKSVLQMSIKNIMHLRSPLVSILCVSGACNSVSFLNIMLMLPSSLESKGMSLQHAAYCFSVVGISGGISRCLITTLSDYKWFNSSLAYLTMLTMSAATTIVFTYTSNFTYIVVCFGIYGIAIGAANGLTPVLLINYIGVNQMERTLGAFGFVSALMYIIVGPIVGHIRDVTGSYVILFLIFSGISLFGVLIWIFVPCALSYGTQTEDSEKDIHVTKL